MTVTIPPAEPSTDHTSTTMPKANHNVGFACVSGWFTGGGARCIGTDSGTDGSAVLSFQGGWTLRALFAGRRTVGKQQPGDESGDRSSCQRSEEEHPHRCKRVTGGEDRRAADEDEDEGAEEFCGRSSRSENESSLQSSSIGSSGSLDQLPESRTLPQHAAQRHRTPAAQPAMISS